VQTSTLVITEATTAVCSEAMAPAVHFALTMLNTISHADLSTVVGGACTCSQAASPAPSCTPQPKQPQPQQPKPQPQPAPQPAQSQCKMTCEQMLQSIASLLGQFTKQGQA
jgi:hypothetical protein